MGLRCRRPARPGCFSLVAAATQAVPVGARSVSVAWISRIVVAGRRIAPTRGEVAAERGLECTGDDVLGIGVVAEVVRDRVDGLLVAVEWIEAVDSAVVEPVGEHLLAALRRCARRARSRERGDGAQREREDRDERAKEAGGCQERDLIGAAGSPGLGVFRRGVSRWCAESKRFVRRHGVVACRASRTNRARC